MDTWLAIASKRDLDRYSDTPIPPEVVARTLDAGRLAGSARNRQPWRFLVVESPDLKERLADTVYEPDNVRGATLVIAVAGKASLDVGRAIQNMMLAAWNEGVTSSPNGMPDPDRVRELLGLGEDESVAIVLTFGYPARPIDPQRRSPEEWSGRANRKPLDEITSRV
jgi:nitroreductase